MMTPPPVAILRDGERIPMTAVHVGREDGSEVFEALPESLLPGDLPLFLPVEGATVRFLGPAAA